MTRFPIPTTISMPTRTKVTHTASMAVDGGGRVPHTQLRQRHVPIAPHPPPVAGSAGLDTGSDAGLCLTGLQTWCTPGSSQVRSWRMGATHRPACPSTPRASTYSVVPTCRFSPIHSGQTGFHSPRFLNQFNRPGRSFHTLHVGSGFSIRTLHAPQMIASPSQ